MSLSSCHWSLDTRTGGPVCPRHRLSFVARASVASVAAVPGCHQWVSPGDERLQPRHSHGASEAGDSSGLAWLARARLLSRVWPLEAGLMSGPGGDIGWCPPVPASQPRLPLTGGLSSHSPVSRPAEPDTARQSCSRHRTDPAPLWQEPSPECPRAQQPPPCLTCD